jgi:hypothetical protein
LSHGEVGTLRHWADEIRIMNKTTVLYCLALAGVPIAFAGYVHSAYSSSLARGTLPFLGTQEMRWWIAFVVSLLLGATMVASAQHISMVRRVLWSALYLVAMAVVPLGIHLTVACGQGDCL